MAEENGGEYSPFKVFQDIGNRILPGDPFGGNDENKRQDIIPPSPSPAQEQATRFYTQSLAGQNPIARNIFNQNLDAGVRSQASVLGSTRGLNVNRATDALDRRSVEQNALAQNEFNKALVALQQAAAMGIQAGALSREQMALNAMIANETNKYNRAGLEVKQDAADAEMVGSFVTTAGTGMPA